MGTSAPDRRGIAEIEAQIADLTATMAEVQKALTRARLDLKFARRREASKAYPLAVDLTTRRFHDGRRAIIAEEFPKGTPTCQIRDMVNAEPGLPTTNRDIAVEAVRLGVKRPKPLNVTGSRTSTTNPRGQYSAPTWTNERILYLKSHYPTEEPLTDILQALNEMAGTCKIRSTSAIVQKALDLKLYRPNPKLQPKPKAKPAAKRDVDVDSWIAEHGVTKCPVAAAHVTTAAIPEDARVALIRYRAHIEATNAAMLERRRAAARKGNQRSAHR